MVAPGETRIGVYGLAIDAGRVLLARIARHFVDQGEWTLPGGGLDWGEDPADGLRREFFEETGLEPVILGPLAVLSSMLPAASRPRSDVDIYALQVIYRTEATGAPVAEIDGSTDLAQWWPLTEIDQIPVVALVREALELAGLRKGLAPRPPNG